MNEMEQGIEAKEYDIIIKYKFINVNISNL